jgi:TonB-dependent starch-binding outer membrane protein SusC
LKDASASIYGVRGANGVIVVTTKKGRAGKAKFSYDGYAGIQTAGKGIENTTPQEYAEALWTAQRNSGVANPSNPQYGNGPVPILPDYLFPRGAKEGDPGTDPSTYDLATNPIARANKAGTDWLGEIMRPAFMTSHTVTASGGSDKNSYLFSFGYLDQKGTLMATYLKRYSVRANTQFSFKDRFRIGENAYVFFKDNPSLINGNLTEGNSISQALFANNILPVYDIAGNYVGDRLTTVFGDNTVATQKRTRDNKSNDWQIQGNVYAELDILKGLTARTSIGGFVQNFYNYAFNYTRYEHSTQSNAANSFTEISGYNSSKTFTNTLTYSNAFGDHNLKVLAGSEYVSQYGRGQASTRGRYFSTDPNFWTLNSGDPTTQANSNVPGTPYKSTIYSLFSRLDYSFSDKYLLSATVRRDGASVFAPQNRYGIFPAASAGWRISSERFMETVKWINELKVRGSWGSLGSISNINPTNPYNLYSSGAGTSNYDINGTNNATVQGFYASQYGNVNTTWEKDIITNIGVDANLLNNKVDLTVEWYKKKIEGLLFRPTIPATAGGGLAPFVNLGDIQNTGIDFNGTYHGKLTKDFNFDVSGNITVYKTKVVKLPFEYVEFGSVRNGTPVRVREGSPIGTFFGYKVIGLFQNDQDVAKSPVQDQAAPGRFKYADINGDNKITDADRTNIGNPNPDFTYGASISLRYKNFDFSTFLYGSQGNDIYNAVKYYNYFPFQNFQGALAKEAYVNAWTPQNTNTTIPKLETSSNFSTSGPINSFYIENGSYLRCKQMMLGYNLPKATLNNWGIDRLRVYVQAANLFTITKYSGLDPEVSSSNVLSTTVFGLDLGNYPPQRTFLVGINLGF